MEEGILIKIGGELVKMEKVSYRVFRRINPKLNSKWLCYFDGRNYYRFPKETSLDKILEQAKLFLDQEMVYPANDFTKKFGFLGIYIYNNLLFFDDKDLPEILKVFRNSLKIYMKEDKIPFLLPNYNIEYKKENWQGKRRVMLTGKGKDFLSYWLMQVFQDTVKVLNCEAPDCQRIFIPTRKSSLTAQRFCSESCRGKTYNERKKKKILSKNLT